MPFKRQISPKQAAQALDVSEASVKRWCDRGLLAPSVTAGGHRRIPVSEVLRFVRARGADLVRPEVLGLPSTTGTGHLAFERAGEEAFSALSDGDEDRFRRLLLNLFLEGRTVAEIGDLVVGPAFARIGAEWEHGSLCVHQERRAVETCLRGVFALDAAAAFPSSRAPLAIGGTLEGDPYVLGSHWCVASLHEAGWRAESYGGGLPAEELAGAVRRRSPRLCWISATSRDLQPAAFAAQAAAVRAAADAVGARVVFGGGGLSPAVRAALGDVRVCDDLRQLVAYAAGLRLTVADGGAAAAPDAATEPAPRRTTRRRRAAT